MKCAICRNGNTQLGYITVVLEKDEVTLVCQRVPAQIGNNCEEEYVSAAINNTLLQSAQAEFNQGVMLKMFNFAA